MPTPQELATQRRDRAENEHAKRVDFADKQLARAIGSLADIEEKGQAEATRLRARGEEKAEAPQYRLDAHVMPDEPTDADEEFAARLEEGPSECLRVMGELADKKIADAATLVELKRGQYNDRREMHLAEAGKKKDAALAAINP